MKVSVWDKILKVIIAVASAIAGVIGGQAIGI
ncbi:smalltalk protein [Bacteroides eggerthii]|uniref:Smalltalk protein n=1 Tax=Bacteroides eggerthii TaxID=28111 RepID=A0A7X9SDI8_9BACE|nr:MULTISPECIES: smalltalk protein [Bacteroides]MBP7129637.1 smalltalk protein [Bacteroides sp.]KAA5274558.1 smalltalk protein [Bacteroides eggerthii]KAA5287625.1 smalltalk protein [Bacteroides eggerthii]MBS6693250.1 smalltalk protein [Bacteroides eggerthii]MBT9883183.1 smalltalk protein [Bacteroides eggerthii]